jgi:hypothetical protein
MPKTLSLCLSVYWLATFVAAAITRLPVLGEALVASEILAAVCHTLAATFFLNAAVTAWTSNGEECVASVRVAVGIALVALAMDGLLVSADIFAGGRAAIQAAALGVTYLVVDAEAKRYGALQQEKDEAGAIARDLARAAGHNVILSRFPAGNTPRTDG